GSGSLWNASQTPERRATAPAVLKRSAHSRQASSVFADSGKLATMRYLWPSNFAVATLWSQSAPIELGEMWADGARRPSCLRVASTCCGVRPKLLKDQSSSTSVYPILLTAAKVRSGSAFMAFRTE